MNDVDLNDRLRLRDLLDTGSISDALDSFGVWSVLPPAVRHVGGARRKFFGKAYTICWGPVRKGADIRAPMPSTWTNVRQFLAPEIKDGTGTVYVGGSINEPIDLFALAGGLSAYHFDRIGMEAVVLGGAMRDIDDLTQRSMPIWATATSPADTQGNYAVISTGQHCRVAGLHVETGDWVFGDSTGIVVIPHRLYEGVIRRALEIVAAEAALQKRLEAGEGLLEILERSGHI